MGSYNFDGNDFLQVDTSPVTAAPLTVACWARVTENVSDACPVSIVDKDAGTEYFALRFEGGDVGDPIQFQVRASSGGGTAACNTTSGYAVDAWHHLCGVERTSTDRSCFIDGGSEGTNADLNAPTGVDRITVGRLGDSSPSNPLNDGKVGWVFIWNVALTDAEVAEHFAGTIPQEANLLAAYDLTQDWGAGPVENAVNPGTHDLAITGATFDGVNSPPESYTFGGGGEGVTGTAAQTLPALTQDAGAEATVTGAAAAALPALTQAAAASASAAGAITSSLPGLTQDAAGGATVEAVAAGTLPALDQAAAATSTVEGSAVQQLPPLSQTATGQVPIDGVAGPIGQTLPALAQDATGELVVTGDADSILPAFAQDAAATVTVHGTAAGTLGTLTSTSTGTVTVGGDGAQILPGLAQQATGKLPGTGAIESTLPALTQAATGRAGLRLVSLTLSASPAHTLTLSFALEHNIGLEATLTHDLDLEAAI